MTNLNELFARDMAFRDIVVETAARAIGSTSKEFAEEWLMAGGDNARSAKRAAAVERLRANPSDDTFEKIIAAVIGCTPLFTTTRKTRDMLIDLLTDEPMDAQQDINRTCPNDNETASNSEDSREKLEDDVCNWIHERRNHYAGSIGAIHQIYEWLDRQAEITRKTEQAAWIQQANGLIHEANVERDELRDAINVLQNKQPYCYDPDKPLDTIKTIGRYIDELQTKVGELTELNEYHSLQYDLAYEDSERLQAQVDNLTDELAKRDKGIERLKRQRDTARAKIDELHAECDTCCYKTDYIEMDFYDVERLEAERDALAADLHDCERQRERLRQALGTAIDHAHEIVSLVNLDGEVIG